MDSHLLQLGDKYVRKHLLDVTSLLVVRHGKLVFEKYYYYGGSPQASSDVQSVTKSVISALVGIALARGDLKSLDQKLVDFLPAADLTARTDPRIRGVTLRDLLTMRAGFKGDVITNFDYTNSEDWPKALVNRKLVRDPGSKFAYDSGTAHLLSTVLTKATGMSAADYARLHLFGPLGFGNVPWPEDPTGNSYGGWGLELTSRQMVQLGLLYLHHGRWLGKQVVPASWVAASTAKEVDTHATGSSTSASGYPPWRGYGYLWWRYPRTQPGGFMAVGRGGQYIIVWPKLDLVVVIKAVVQDANWDLAGLLEKYVLPAVKA
jgi:CubicO group peptidase (beta-lactamase class C family)